MIQSKNKMLVLVPIRLAYSSPNVRKEGLIFELYELFDDLILFISYLVCVIMSPEYPDKLGHL